MEFLRSVVPFHPMPEIRTGMVLLRPPALSDFAAWASLRAESRAFLTPWEPLWPVDDLTRGAFKRRLRRYQREIRESTGYPFLVFTADGRQLVGGLTLSHVVRGVTQSCSLGYWMGAPYAGKGLMTAAVKAVIPFVFDTLRLHRLEAACLPHNAASIRLLEKAGFSREGYARRYLCIEGRWQDHLLYAIVSDDPRP
ncbi:GNAT family N-acetyltransferase [Kaistia sp. 32K]|uniref:GNAT family N-acetyltransferase n=1 Tax=Kaistia sp. 32K TaxID=2795690 RepID=UPI001915513F|nr:GNAT family protein [Kaistia sp. 32K]